MAKNIKLETPPFDARFPNANQTRNCWQNYVDFHKCVKAKGEDYEACQYFKRCYQSLCPVSWVSALDIFLLIMLVTFITSVWNIYSRDDYCTVIVDKLMMVCFSCTLQISDWDEQRDTGNFPGKI